MEIMEANYHIDELKLNASKAARDETICQCYQSSGVESCSMTKRKKSFSFSVKLNSRISFSFLITEIIEANHRIDELKLNASKTAIGETIRQCYYSLDVEVVQRQKEKFIFNFRKIEFTHLVSFLITEIMGANDCMDELKLNTSNNTKGETISQCYQSSVVKVV